VLSCQTKTLHQLNNDSRSHSSHPQALGNHCSTSCLCTCMAPHTGGTVPYLSFLSLVYLTRRNVLKGHTCDVLEFPSFLMEVYSIIRTHLLFLLHSSVLGHLSCFYFLAIVSRAAVNNANYSLEKLLSVFSGGGLYT
jgi:hypothetical protein